MKLIFVVLSILGVTAAIDECLTPSRQPGECVLLNHCPHLFNLMLQNRTSERTKDYIRQSHCGFHSVLFPKVCCPMEAIEIFEQNNPRHGSICGLHGREGPNDPWLALIQYEGAAGETSALCGGVVINKRYVLTAAHCVKGPGLPRVKVSNVLLGDGSYSIPVDDSVVHEEYDPADLNQYNDIALLRLKKRIDFKQGTVRPICLPKNDGTKYEGAVLATAGWDRFQSGFEKKSGIAHLWSNIECSTKYNVTGVRLETSQMCAGGRKQHRMELGEVLMHVGNDTSYSIVGMTSVKPACCGKEQFTVYTRVYGFVNWIVSKLKP